MQYRASMLASALGALLVVFSACSDVVAPPLQVEPTPERLHLNGSLAFAHAGELEGVFLVSANFWLHADGRLDQESRSSPWAYAVHNVDEGWISLAANRPRAGSSSDHLVLIIRDEVLLSHASTADEISGSYYLNYDWAFEIDEGGAPLISVDEQYLLVGQVEYRSAAENRFAGSFELRGAGFLQPHAEIDLRGAFDVPLLRFVEGRLVP
jgi:hypothetical protein